MGVRNKLTDMHNILFEQLERLNEEELDGELMDKEIKRSKAVTDVAKTIVNNGNLMLSAKKHIDEHGHEDKDMPILIGKSK